MVRPKPDGDACKQRQSPTTAGVRNKRGANADMLPRRRQVRRGTAFKHLQPRALGTAVSNQGKAATLLCQIQLNNVVDTSHDAMFPWLGTRTAPTHMQLPVTVWYRLNPASQSVTQQDVVARPLNAFCLYIVQDQCFNACLDRENKHLDCVILDLFCARM